MAVLARRPGAPRGAARKGDFHAWNYKGRFKWSKVPKKTAEQKRLDEVFRKFGHGGN